MNDQDMERVLKSVGPREKPPAEVERAVREHLRAEWRAVVAERGRRNRQRTYFALAAGLVASAVAIWALAPRTRGAGRRGRHRRARHGRRARDLGLVRRLARRRRRPVPPRRTDGRDGRHGSRRARPARWHLGALGSRLAAGRCRPPIALVLERGALYVDSGSTPTRARAARRRHAERNRAARRHAVRSAAARLQRAAERARRRRRMAIERRRRGAEQFRRAAHHHERRPHRANRRSGLRRRLGLDARGRSHDRHRGPAARAIPRLGRAGNRPRSRLWLTRRPRPKRQASWSTVRSPG